jgi:hypothetical protein
VATTKKAKSKPAKQQTKPNKQNDLIIVLIISLILGFGGGYLLGANNSSDTNSSVATMEEASMAHPHDTKYEVQSDTAPKVELVVSEDAKSGYNVKIIAKDFVFTPENANEKNVIGQGHAHLYVDGVKVARVYGNYFHYPEDFEGSKEFRVTLNANDHSEYAINGDTIDSTVIVTHDSSSESHDEMHMDSEDQSHSDM